MLVSGSQQSSILRVRYILHIQIHAVHEQWKSSFNCSNCVCNQLVFILHSNENEILFHTNSCLHSLLFKRKHPYSNVFVH